MPPEHRPPERPRSAHAVVLGVGLVVLAFAGLSLWALRQQDGRDPAAQRERAV